MKTELKVGAVFLAAMVFLAGCATTPKYNPFRVPKADIRATVKTIAVFNLTTNNPVEANFDRLIEGKLREVGFSTIGWDQINPIAQRKRQELGGFFDPQTGVEDKGKKEAYWHDIVQELKTNYNIEGVLTFSVVNRPAPFYGNRAEWDGASEEIYMHYGLADMLLANGTEYGTTRGLSLKVILSNLQREDLFVNYGGIQLMSKLARPSRSFSAQGFVDVPESQLFTDTNRIYGAVTNALGPLTN